TYDVTRLMRLEGPRRFLVTTGGRDHVDPATVLAEMTYSHPMYTPESVAAQKLLPTLDDDRVVFAGAYHGWGFHEDGAASGLRAAQRLGAQWPSIPREAVPCVAPRCTAPRSRIFAGRRCTTTSSTAATPGTSTSTTCPSCRDGCGRSPGSRRTTSSGAPGPASGTILCGNASTLSWRSGASTCTAAGSPR